MIGYYDYRLVALSLLIAVFASYTALDLGGRTTAASDRVRLTWLAGRATAMGVGIWSMHYIGMLALFVVSRKENGLASRGRAFTSRLRGIQG